jgi:hypothetical protein
MSQKKRVRVYKPGQIDNSMNSWFMQMGGMPQQPQQQDMATQVMQYAQQMIMEGEDPNNVYDDLVNQGVPSQLAAQVIEQLMESMPPQPSYSQPTTAEAMYNQEVEEAEEEEAIPDFMDLAGLYDDEDDDDFEDFKKGGMTKNKFIKEYKKLALGGQKSNEVSKRQSVDFLGAVQNTFKNAKAEEQAEEMYNNRFAVNPLAPFVYGGSLPKADNGGAAGPITQEAFDKYTADFEKYKKEQEERYKQLEQRYNQGYRNYPQQYNPYLYGNPYGQGYGQGYGNVPTMFNPYGRRGPIIQRTPYLQNFPGADFQGMQLTKFNIDPQKIDRKGLLKFLGPKTKYTWSGEWTRNPQTGAVTPATSTTNTSNTTNTGTAPPAARPGSVAPGYVPSALGPGFSGYNADTDGDGIPDYFSGEPVLPAQTAIQPTTYGPENTPRGEFRTSVDYADPRYEKSYKEQEIIKGDVSDENLDGFYFPNNTPARFDFVTGKFIEIPKQKYGGYRFQPGGSVFDMNDEEIRSFVPERMTPISPNYGDLMAATPGLVKSNEPIKNAYTIDIPAAYDKIMHGALSFTNSLNNNMEYRDSLANSMGMAAGPEQSGQRGNYTVNQLANSSNFRPDLDGQIQYSQYGGQFELGEETEMTDEEIEKFLKGGGKLRFV